MKEKEKPKDQFSLELGEIGRHFSESETPEVRQRHMKNIAKTVLGKALAMERQQLLSIFDSIDEVIYVSDPDTYEVLYGNQAIKKDLGRDPVGEKCHQAFQGIEQPCPFCTNKHIFGDNLGRSYIWEFQNRNNKRWYRCIDKAIRWPDGRMVRYEMAIDINDRRRAEESLQESEERYRTLFEESRDAIYITSREGNFIDVNRAAIELFGYAREDMIKHNAENLYVNPDDRQRFQQEIEKRGYVRDFEAKFRKKDGSEIICLLTSTVRQMKDGSIPGYQGMIRDITEKRKMEAELLKAEKLESIGLLAGGIAHDFNNVLTAILGNITVAMTHVKSEEKISQRLTAAEKACLRARDLTQQLLTFSKGGAPIKKSTDIKELIKDSAGFALRGSNVRCDFALPDALLPVEVDEGQINRVVNNLVINADQSMPEGGTITIRAENATVKDEQGLPLKNGEYVKITVQDHGIGIPKEHLSKIFDPYFTTKEMGSGLGLASSYSIVKKHDGHIAVESEQGVGTTFSLYLPASPRPSIEHKAAAEAPCEGKGRILVMDDEEIVRDVVGHMLISIGYEAGFARDGAEAINLYKKAKKSGEPFDAVIMDLTIPGGMGGKEAVKKLLSIDPHVKVFVSSGYSNDPIMADYRKYGFTGFVAKPYKLKELCDVLQIVMER